MRHGTDKKYPQKVSPPWINKWMKVHHFHNGLTGTTRTLLDAPFGGALMSKRAN